MTKTVLHTLIDMIDETDTETIYKVLLKFVPEDEPLPDEVQSFQEAMTAIKNGDVLDFNKVEWD